MNQHDAPTPTGDPWEREMTSEFDRRVRDLHEAPLSLDAVKGKAVRIRRTRRAAVAGGVLAAAAVVVPVAVIGGSGGGGDTAPDPVDPATATDQDRPALPAYVEGRAYHATDGTVFDLPEASYRQVVEVGDQLVAYRSVDDQVALEVIGADGAVVDTYVGAQDPVVSAGGDVLAFLTQRGEVRVLWDGGAETLSGGFDGWTAQAVDGGPDCATDAGCRVFLRDETGTEGVVALTSGGTVTPVPEVVNVTDSDGAGRLAVISSTTDDGACGGVVEEGGRTLFDSCEATPRAFSPDGRLVLAVESPTDGIGTDLTLVLDATTGAEVARIESGTGFFNRAVWLDDETVAASLFDDAAQTWSVLTLRVGDAAPRTVLGPVAGGMDEPVYRLVGAS